MVLLIGVLGIAARSIPVPTVWSLLSYDAIEVFILAAMVWGIRRHRPAPAGPWWLLATGLGLLVVGDVIYNALTLVTGSEVFPSVADAFYVASYAVLCLGVLAVLRRRRHEVDRTALVDALLVIVVATAATWVYLIDPAAYGRAPLLEGLVLAAYPVGDIVLLAVLARMLIAPRRRQRSEALLATGITLLLVADVVYARLAITGSYSVGTWLDALYHFSYLCFALAATHPTMVALAEPEAPGGSRPRSRIAILVVVSLVLPLLAAAEAAAGHVEDMSVLGGAAVAALFLLTLRTGILNRTLAAALDGEERAVERERVLRALGTALVGTTDRDVICAAAVEHARRLACDGTGAVMFLGRPSLVAVAAGGALPDFHGRSLPWDRLPPEVAAPLSAGKATVVGPAAAEVLAELIPELPADRVVLAAPVLTGGVPAGIVFVAADAACLHQQRLLEAYDTVGSTVSLALEAADLAERLVDERSEQRFGALIRHSSDILLVLREDGTLRYLSPSVTRILGWEASRLVGRHVSQLVHPDDAAPLAIAFGRVLVEGRTPAPVRCRYLHRNGSWRSLEALAVNMADDPAVGGIVVNVRDVTERVRLEASLRASEERLARQVEELRELDRIKDDFVSTASHELRTPLANILAQLEVMGDGDFGHLNDDQAHSVAVMERNARRLLNLVEDLLTLSRIESVGVGLEPAPTDLRALIDDVRASLPRTTGPYPAPVRYEIDPQLGVVTVDGAKLERVLVNLLGNARKFTPADGSVTLRAERTPDSIVFTVSDTGIGVPAAEQDRLFTRFFRSSSATANAIQGTGLGLVIAKSIVEAHGGTIELASEEGVGTTVTVTLPVVPADDVATETAAAAVAA